MAKPVAFADEQIDADLWQIVGPWDHVQQRPYRDSIRSRSRVAPVLADPDKLPFSIGDEIGSAGKSSFPHSVGGSCRKSLVRRLVLQRSAIIMATVVAALGAGLYALTNDVTEQQKAVASQSASNSAKTVVQARVGNQPTYPREITILEQATKPPFALPKTSGSEFTKRAAQGLPINKGPKRKASGVGRLAIAKHNTLKSKASADEPFLTSLPYDFVGLISTKASPSNSLLEEPNSTTEATTPSTKENSVTDRRDSVQAMRSLRRQ
jgi:hypothetical protein